MYLLYKRNSAISAGTRSVVEIIKHESAEIDWPEKFPFKC